MAVPGSGYEALTYGNGVFVASGPGPTVSSASDGLNWGNATDNGGHWDTGAAFGAGLLVTGGGNGIQTSTDGVTWNTSIAFPSWYPTITYGNGLFVAVGDYENPSGQSYIQTSPDGVNWTARTSPITDPLWAVGYGGGTYVALSPMGPASSQVITSPDGITWTTRTAAIQSSWQAISYGNGIFVAASADGPIMTSADGMTWVQRNAPTEPWSSIAFGNGLFVAVASSGAVISSPDGIHWTGESAPSASSWKSIAFGNNYFVAIANSGTNEVMRARTASTPAEVQAVPALSRWGALLLGCIVGLLGHLAGRVRTKAI